MKALDFDATVIVQPRLLIGVRIELRTARDLITGVTGRETLRVW